LLGDIDRDFVLVSVSAFPFAGVASFKGDGVNEEGTRMRPCGSSSIGIVNRGRLGVEGRVSCRTDSAGMENISGGCPKPLSKSYAGSPSTACVSAGIDSATMGVSCVGCFEPLLDCSRRLGRPNDPDGPGSGSKVSFERDGTDDNCSRKRCGEAGGLVALCCPASWVGGSESFRSGDWDWP